MWQMKKMMWISGKLTFPLDANSFLWQGCTFRAQSNSLRGFDGYGETGKHHLSLRKASQSTRRAPLWSHNCRRCHLSGSLHDGSPSPSGDVQIASEALNFSPEPEFRSLFLVYFRNKIREEKRSRTVGLLSAGGLCHPIQQGIAWDSPDSSVSEQNFMTKTIWFVPSSYVEYYITRSTKMRHSNKNKPVLYLHVYKQIEWEQMILDASLPPYQSRGDIHVPPEAFKRIAEASHFP